MHFALCIMHNWLHIMRYKLCNMHYEYTLLFTSNEQNLKKTCDNVTYRQYTEFTLHDMSALYITLHNNFFTMLVFLFGKNKYSMSVCLIWVFVFCPSHKSMSVAIQYFRSLIVLMIYYSQNICPSEQNLSVCSLWVFCSLIQSQSV